MFPRDRDDRTDAGLQDPHTEPSRVSGPTAPRSRILAEFTAAEFKRELQTDIRVLRQLIADGALEKIDTCRIGAEREQFLVSAETGRPMQVNGLVVEALQAAETDPKARDKHDIEMGQAQIEERDGVRLLTGKVYSEQERDVVTEFEKVRAAAAAHGAKALPTGILFTAERADLDLGNMTSSKTDRYHRANQHALNVRGGNWDISVGEVSYRMDNIMTVSQLASHQPHLQVSAEQMVAAHNTFRAMAGFILAPCVASPLLLRKGGVEGEKTHQESRIALFEQAWDPARVTFGDRYISDIIDPFERLAQLDVVFLERLERQADESAPGLPYLRLQNGSVHDWDRAIYDVYKGVPHVRTEVRYIPIVPDPLSNVANGAWAVGLALGAMRRFPQFSSGEAAEAFCSFDYARGNFREAAQHGLSGLFTFPGIAGKVRLQDVRVELGNIAREGLRENGVSADDVDRFIGSVERRLGFERTPRGIIEFEPMTEADWMRRTLQSNLAKGLSRDDALLDLVHRIEEASSRNIPCYDR